MSAAPVIALPTRDEYEAIPARNWSTLKHIATSPRMLRYRVEHPQAETDAFELGRAFHCALLEPERWASSYVARPYFGDGRTKKAKAARTAWQATLPAGVEVIDAEQHALAERCARAVREHPAAARLLRAGRVEEIVQWSDEETGIACKARMDLVTPFYVLDLKSTRRQSLHRLVGDIASFLYHGQLAFYHDGARASRLIPPDADGPYLIVVQTDEPFDVVPMRLDPTDLMRGRALYRSLLRRYIECQAAEWWPGIAPEVIDLVLPSWAAGGEEERTDW